MRAYLDYNATAPLRAEAREAMLAAMDLAGNPSSIHAEGRAARALVEDARREIAALVGASPRDLVFTSGGTEAANLALRPGWSAPGAAPALRLIAGATEHACVLDGHGFGALLKAPVGREGIVDLDALDALLDGPPALVALQAANNETGVLQPIPAIAERVHAVGGLLVCDAAQAAGRLTLPEALQGADAVLLSAHKFGGPKGAGAWIALRSGLTGPPLLRGGGQERGRRAGTENVAAIAGFGAAARLAREELDREPARLAALRDDAERRVAALGGSVFGQGAPRLPNTLAFALPGLSASSLLMRLDLEGVAVSSGSACSSGKVGPSHVLAAMGLSPDLAAGAIRVSLGWASTPAEVEFFVAALQRAVSSLKRRENARL